MTGPAAHATSAIPDDSTLARAAARWGSFYASLDDDECELLDRFALGENLKAVCFELGLNYDTIRKRLIRRQDALGLPSTATFLHFWMTVRNLGRGASDPTMLRYAELLRASLGYAPSLVLPPPQDSAMVTRLRSLFWRPGVNANSRERADAEALTLALLSPVAWHAVLRVAPRGTWDCDALPAIPAQHELFRAIVGVAPAPSASALRHVKATYADTYAARNTRDMLRAPWLAPLLSMQALHSALVATANLGAPREGVWHAPAPLEEEAFAAGDDYRYWQQLSDALGSGDRLRVQQVVATINERHQFGPLTGLALAVSFFNTCSPPLRAMLSPTINRLVSTRLHLAESLQIHPVRLLAHIAQLECGLAAGGDGYLLLADERLAALSVEQLLPEVRQLASQGGTTAPKWAS